ncbi:MAG: glycosyltransferase family 2 protein [Halothece sp.]
MMKFSVVITTYNRLPLLKRAIQTSLNQTIPCEVIVVDDCSSDGTKDYVTELVASLEKEGCSRLIYSCNPTNLGHSRSVNQGVELASGDWIKLLDDDDYLALNCLEEMENAIALRPEAVICSCQAAQVDENEVEITRTQLGGPGKAFYIPQEDVHYYMLVEMLPFIGTPVQVAVKRDAFLQSGGWDSALDGNFDDADSWVKIAQFGDLIFLNQCLAYRTVWLGAYNYRFSFEKRLETNLLIKEKIYNFIKPKYREIMPKFKTIAHYLKLHWSLVALKQGKILTAAKIAFPSIFVYGAWKLLVDRASNLGSTPEFYTIPLRSEGFTNFSEPDRLNPKHLELIKVYLKYRWGITSFQEGKILRGINNFLFSLFSLAAWNLLLMFLFPNFYATKSLNKPSQDSNYGLMETLYSKLTNNLQGEEVKFEDMETYLKLRWSLSAFQERHYFEAMRLATPTLLSPLGWKLLAKVARFNYWRQKEALVRKIVLLSKNQLQG